MNKIINDVYQGIYYHALKYETVEDAKSSMKLRMVAVLFLYYMGLVVLSIGVRVKIYGPFKPSVLETFVAIFGIYTVLYRFLIHPRILKFSFNHSIEERKRKIKVSHLVFTGSILTFFTCFAIVGVLYKR